MNGTERLKAFRSIRRGVERVVDIGAGQSETIVEDRPSSSSELHHRARILRRVSCSKAGSSRKEFVCDGGLPQR
jgi:hypothetical protein